MPPIHSRVGSFSPMAVAATLALIIAGCASPARQRSQQAVASIENTRDEVSAGEKEIDQVLATLDKLEAQPANLTPVYSTFAAQVRDIEARATRVAARVRDMRVRAAAYSANWEVQNQTISDEQLRASAADRAEAVRERYGRIQNKAQEVRAAYDPFIDQLNDLKTFLANDLTYAGVRTAEPVFGTVRSRAAELKQRISDLVADLDEMSRRMSPTTRDATP